MELTTERLVGQLANEPLRPVYLVAGSETLRVIEAADAVRAAARAQGCNEREVFDAGERGFDWGAMYTAFGSFGLFSSQRLIELRLPGGKPGKDGSEVIRQFCEDPPAGTTLLIIADDWSKAHAGKWSEAIAACGHVVIGWPVKPHELEDWLERRLRSRGVRADRDAVAQLAQRIDGNLLAAAQEVDKLALLAEGRTLDADTMQTLVADAARYDVFRLTDAALNGQPAQVTRVLHGLRAEGEVIPALLGMVIRELQIAASLAQVQARGGNLNGEFRAQRIWESKQALYTRALKRHAAPRWLRFLAEAGRVDRQAKGREQGDAWVTLERLLVAVADPRAMSLVAS